MRIIDLSFLDKLTSEAKSSKRLRKHVNLHANHLEPCQRIINAIEPQSYIRPHRHFSDPKVEFLTVLRGRFAVLFFDCVGEIDDIQMMSMHLCHDISSIEIYPEDWHTVISLTSGSVLFETKSGPYEKQNSKDLAAWAPEEGSVHSKQFLNFLISSLEEVS